MNRKIIDLNKTNLTLGEVEQLKNYVWKNNQLIPEEQINGSFQS